MYMVKKESLNTCLIDRSIYGVLETKFEEHEVQRSGLHRQNG